MLSVSSTNPENQEKSISIHLVRTSGLSEEIGHGTIDLALLTTDEQEEEELDTSLYKNDNSSKTEGSCFLVKKKKAVIENTSTE